MSLGPALRVLRGPDWQGGDSDGGESYLGTVLQLLSNHQVHVLWDMGQESTCRTGQDGKFDLRVFDSAPLGIRHVGTQCAECGQQDVYGMLWRCQLCPSCHLCSLCYADDKHDTRHQFLRIDTPGAAGQLQRVRKTSVKIRSIGLHPGARVTRGRDWEWGDQDGGQGSEGEVIGHEDDPEAARGLLRVQWADGSVYSYRLGLKGKVDVTCVEEEVGPAYYRDHLPLLDTTATCTQKTNEPGENATPETVGKSNTPETVGKTITPETARDITTASETACKPGVTHFGNDSEVSVITDGAKSDINKEPAPQPSAEEAEDKELCVGERVAIRVDRGQLEELQKDSGGCTDGMFQCIGRTGEVTHILSRDVVAVRFAGLASKICYRFNPKALLKVTSRFSVNDEVRVRSDVTLLRVLNSRLGWKPAMDQFANKMGRVVRVDEVGDLRVDFRGTQLELAPACCVPVTEAPRTPLASLGSSSPDTGAGGSADGAGISPGPGTAQASSTAPSPSSYSSSSSTIINRSEHLDHFQQIRDLLQNESRKKGRSRSGVSLFAAIECEDTARIRRICEEDPSMLEREVDDLTPLIHAVFKGRYSSVLTLLELGADVNRASSDDPHKTPMLAVAEGKHDELTELLVLWGADVHKRYMLGSTMMSLMHLCVVHNRASMAKTLIEHGADVNDKDDDGDTALHSAIGRRKHEMMAVLVDTPTVDIHMANRRGFNTIHLAAFVNNPRAMERLLARDSSQVNAKTISLCPSAALHIAATNDHVDCVRLLVLQGGADINIRQDDGSAHTALILTCYDAFLQTTEALLELGADVNMKDGNGRTALHVAVGGGGRGKGEGRDTQAVYRIQIANLLISSGAYVDEEDNDGRDPLDYGASAVKKGVRAFIRNNPGVVKRKREKTNSLLQSLGVPSLTNPNPSRLNEALKGFTLPCGVCGARKSDVTLRPCGHRCVCITCRTVTTCPLCDAEVKDTVLTNE